MLLSTWKPQKVMSPWPSPANLVPPMHPIPIPLSLPHLLQQESHTVDIIVSTRSSPLPDTSPEPAAALASSKSEKLTSNIFPDIELHVTRLILIPLSLNKIESEELVVDDVEKSFDNNEVSYENLGETIAVTNLGELFNNQNYSSLQLLTT